MSNKKRKKIISILMSLVLMCMIIIPVEQEIASTAQKGTAQYFVDNMKIGWNLGNSLDSYYGDRTGDANLKLETQWGNPKVTKKLIKYVKSQGFDVIRVPVSWYYHTYTDKQGNLHIYKAWLKRVKQVVDYALAVDMKVILDSHHDQKIFYVGTDEESMKQVLSDAQDLWSEIAGYFSAYDQRLLFDGFNEVSVGQVYNDTAAEQMNQLNQIFVTTVRKAGGKNKSRLLIVPTLYESATYQSLNSFTLPQDTVKNKLIVEVHDYSSQFAQDINPLFSRLQSFADKVGAPVIIGEFGTTTSYQPSEYRATHAGNYVARAQKYGIKCIWWDNGGDYALIDRSKLTVKSKKLIKALTNPTVYKNSTLKTYSSMDYFLANKKFDEDGNVIDWVGWGSLVTDMDGKGIAVPENSKYMTASLSAGKGTGFSRIHLIYFYDKDGKLLKSYGQKYDYDALIYAVPEGAKYVRIGIYDRFTANRYDEYATWVAKSKIKLKIAWN